MQMNNNNKTLALDVWQQLLYLLENERSPYLARQEFQVHADAFMRLDDESVESDVPFVVFEAPQTHDNSLPLSLLFFRNYFVINIGPISYSSAYESASFSATEVYYSGALKLRKLVSAEKIASNILLMLKLGLNGQIACVASYYNSRYLASELYLLGFRRQPLEWQISGKFPRYIRTSNQYRIFQNSYLHSHFPIPDDFPFLPVVIDGEAASHGRDIESLDDIQPLSRKTFTTLMDSIQLQDEIGKAPKKDILSFYFTSATFWLNLIIITTLTIYFMNTISEKFVHAIWFLSIIFLVVVTVAIFTTSVFLNLRQSKARYGIETFGMKLDKICKQYGNTVLQLFAILGLRRVILLPHQIALLTLSALTPAWQPKNVPPELLNGLQMAHYTPAILLLFGWNIIPIVFLCLNRQKYSKLVRRVTLTLVTTYPIVMLTYNFAFTVAGDNALDPQSFLFDAYLFLALLSVIAPLVPIAIKRYKEAIKARPTQ